MARDGNLYALLPWKAARIYAVCLRTPNVLEKIEEETKGSGDFQRSTCLFIDSEKNREHTEDEMIKIENIKGKLILIGADDDGLWEVGKYVRRMD